jgi:hypothetical protein
VQCIVRFTLIELVNIGNSYTMTKMYQLQLISLHQCKAMCKLNIPVLIFCTRYLLYSSNIYSIHSLNSGDLSEDNHKIIMIFLLSITLLKLG